MNWRRNLKGWITNLIGLAIWVLTVLMWYNDKIEMVSEGIIALIVGGVFFLLPDHLLTGYLKKYVDKKVKE